MSPDSVSKKEILDPGIIPSLLRISLGIVTWPLVVTDVVSIEIDLVCITRCYKRAPRVWQGLSREESEKNPM